MRRVFLLLILILISVGVFYYFRNRQNPEDILKKSDFTTFFSIGTDRDPLEEEDSDTPSIADTDLTSTPLSPLIQIIGRPIAGYTVFTRTKVIETPNPDPTLKPIKQTVVEYVLRYVSRSNGYVYEMVNDNAPIQISNIYIPNIYEAYFADGNTTAILRFLRNDDQTIATYSVPIPPLNSDNTRTQKEGVYLSDNIRTLTLSPDRKNIAQLIHTVDGSSIGVSGTSGNGRREVLRSPLREWLVFWEGKNIYLQTKASGLEPGYLYRIDQTNKRLIKLLGIIPGLTTSISPKEKYVLISERADTSVITKLFDISTGTTRSIPAAILPEKCVWLANENAICAGNEAIPPALYPDDWYRGTVSFTDTFYLLDTSIGVLSEIEGGSSTLLDAVQLTVNESERALYFIDKKTGYLWRLSY